MAARRPKVLVVGDVIDDIVVRPDGALQADTDTPSRIDPRPGGSAANTACWLAAAGVPTTFVGTVHHLDVARHAAVFAAAGVDARLTGSDLPTGTIVVLVQGQHRSMLTSRGANAATHPGQITDDLLAGATHLHLTGYSLFDARSAGDDAAWSALSTRAHGLGLTRSLDPSSRSFLATHGVERLLRTVAGIEVLLPSADEAALLGGGSGDGGGDGGDDDDDEDDDDDDDEDDDGGPELAATRLARDHDVVAVKLGDRGAVVAANGALHRRTVSPGPVVDPTGAGDAFDAGFLAAWLAGSDPVDAVDAGNALARRAIGIIGARPA
ncbi:carbohydrate kinase family protein [uncultured Amnibacterium sp.]|uniref:carbohydrate kinase family protein n=1 Tax=uncultured Amnibacterium sp. TaxID=1631851 RepID=UPI0035CA70CF